MRMMCLFRWPRNLFLALCLLWIALPFAVAAESAVAQDISAECIFTPSSNEADIACLLDDDPLTYWQNEDMRSGYPVYLQVDTPSDSPAYGVYIEWAYIPGTWSLSVPNPEWERYSYMSDGDPQAKARWISAAMGGAQGFLHEYLPLDGLTSFRIQARQLMEQSMAIASLRVLGEGQLPDWVQTWEPIPPRVDLMAIATHADDELVFYGGLLPTYAGERRLKTAVVYLSYCARERRTELLNGLWVAGVRSYPVMGNFLDYHAYSYDQALAAWDENAVSAFITEQLRRYKPKVVVAQDLEGEYGHGMHMLTARKVLEAVETLAWDENSFPESAARYGTCDVDKLYLHLYPNDQITMNWRVPLPSFGGRTALEVAIAAFAEHRSQVKDFDVLDSGPDNCALFGLASSMVGPDEAKDDLFEHVTPWKEGER